MGDRTQPKKGGSPTLDLEITDAIWDTAVACHSGACAITNAIKAQYPHLSGVSTDMQTIRVTDREKGYRYTYLTPLQAQQTLLALDQGWPAKPFDAVKIKRAAKITPVVSAGPVALEKRAAHIAALEAKEASGDLSVSERRALNISRGSRKRTPRSVDRPTTRGPATVLIPSGSTTPVITGGAPLPQGKPHPGLLRGRRVFGAKLAKPGKAFEDAVVAKAREILASQQDATA
jgi:hypothetical protein